MFLSNLLACFIQVPVARRKTLSLSCERRTRAADSGCQRLAPFKMYLLAFSASLYLLHVQKDRLYRGPKEPRRSCQGRLLLLHE